MLKLMLAVAIVTLAGCADAPETEPVAEAPEVEAPTYKPVHIDHTERATTGVDRTFSWEVGPNATTTSLIVEQSVASGFGRTRNACVTVTSEQGDKQYGSCGVGNVNVAISLISGPVVNISDMEPGKWSLHISMLPSPEEYQLNVDVLY